MAFFLIRRPGAAPGLLTFGVMAATIATLTFAYTASSLC
jgi:hypothetical protein